MSASLDSWPPTEGLSTVVVPRQDAILTTAASCRIHAPASVVFSAVCNVGEYGSWNTFVPHVTVHSQSDEAVLEGDAPPQQQLRLGTSFTFHVVMDATKPNKETPTQLRVTDVSTPDIPSAYIAQDVLDSDASYTSDLRRVYRIAWSTEGGFVARGLKTERFHEIIVINDSECEVRTWENQGNILARTVKWLFQKTLQEKFQLWCDELKKYCEEKTKTSIS